MTKCDVECSPVCDFCIHLERPVGIPEYGESMCRKHQKIVDWGDYCEDFHCFRAVNGKAADPPAAPLD